MSERTTPKPQRALWPWVLLAVLLAVLLGLGLVALQLRDGMVLLDVPVSVSLDGIEQFDGMALSELSDSRKLIVAVGLVVALVIVAVVVPMALLLAFLCAGFGILLALVFGVGLPAVVLLLVGVLLLSPLWVPALLIGWLIARSRRASNAASTATIPA